MIKSDTCGILADGSSERNNLEAMSLSRSCNLHFYLFFFLLIRLFSRLALVDFRVDKKKQYNTALRSRRDDESTHEYHGRFSVRTKK
jgi:hypothetical protein